jgi:hypothetical protein
MRWNEIDRNPTRRKLRQFAGVALFILGGVALWNGADFNDRLLVAGWMIGVLIAIVGLVRPQAVRWLYVGWMIVVFPIGWIVAQTVLVCVYYGVFTPLGLGFRVFGRDVLSRQPQPNVGSYWNLKSPVTDVGSYFRQY